MATISSHAFTHKISLTLFGITICHFADILTVPCILNLSPQCGSFVLFVIIL